MAERRKDVNALFDSGPAGLFWGSRRAPRTWWLLHLAVLSCACLSGCAALTNPVAQGIPVHRLPPEVLGRPREEEIPIPLTRLRQSPPEKYRIAAGDVLGVWIEGVLGARDQAPPVIPPPPGTRLNSSVGIPINVSD